MVSLRSKSRTLGNRKLLKFVLVIIISLAHCCRNLRLYQNVSHSTSGWVWRYVALWPSLNFPKALIRNCSEILGLFVTVQQQGILQTFQYNHGTANIIPFEATSHITRFRTFRHLSKFNPLFRALIKASKCNLIFKGVLAPALYTSLVLIRQIRTNTDIIWNLIG